MTTSMSGKVPFRSVDVAIPGVAYGEYDVPGHDRPIAPFKAAMFVVEPGSVTPRDEHAVREFWFVARGSGTLIYEGGRTPIRAFDSLFFESHRPHSVENTGTESLAIFSVWWSPSAG